jgi:hypothetical protein
MDNFDKNKILTNAQHGFRKKRSKQQIPMLWSLVRPDECSNPRSTTLEASTLTITAPIRFASDIYNDCTIIVILTLFI